MLIRYLLWHGTSTENLLSIMCKGLRIAPNDAASNGHRFGKGIYFSDSFAFSHNYTRGRINTTRATRRYQQPQYLAATQSRNYMVLCEVALGKIKELRNSYESLDVIPPEGGFDSVKSLGRNEPDPTQSVLLPNGCIVPLGGLVQARLEPGENHNSRTEENQYVVYNEAQCCIRYIVQYHAR